VLLSITVNLFPMFCSSSPIVYSEEKRLLHLLQLMINTAIWFYLWKNCNGTTHKAVDNRQWELTWKCSPVCLMLLTQTVLKFLIFCWCLPKIFLSIKRHIKESFTLSSIDDQHSICNDYRLIMSKWLLRKGSIHEKSQCYTRSSLQPALKTDLKMFSALSYVTNYNCKRIFKFLLISSKKFPVNEEGTLRKHLHLLQFLTNMAFQIKIADWLWAKGYW
jgi:hypothetical protein